MNPGRAEFRSAFDVSRETLDRLQIYHDLLLKWNKSINLISRATTDAIWERHFHDSAEAYRVRDALAGTWVDLGSGGGFPGAVAAILAAGHRPNLTITCIEADLRKSAFLRTVALETGVGFQVMSRRIEETPPQRANTLSARALAPLSKLLVHCERHLAEDGRAVFLKGARWQIEVEEALATFDFSVETTPSTTHPGSAILVIGDISRA